MCAVVSTEVYYCCLLQANLHHAVLKRGGRSDRLILLPHHDDTMLRYVLSTGTDILMSIASRASSCVRDIVERAKVPDRKFLQHASETTSFHRLVSDDASFTWVAELDGLAAYVDTHHRLRGV